MEFRVRTTISLAIVINESYRRPDYNSLRGYSEANFGAGGTD